ncbi:hypothetical protein [Acetobacter sp. LMG 32666]|uniref:hypothetical protein n=1 Tax=Acetobacter sp. LMG 32666 TaxID=2959295 RepID=UPI0030C81E75
MCGAESHDYSRSILRMMERRMPLSSTRFWTILAVIGLPVLACLLGMGVGASPLLTTALVGLAGACAAWITTYRPMPATPQPTTTPTPAPPVGNEDPKLRHDIRGIISPAMLVAEQLLLSQDPATHKAATTINDSLDRLTARLKQRNAG